VHHATASELESGVDTVRTAPADNGTLKLIVARPEEERREFPGEARIERGAGLVGDMWSVRPSSSTDDGGPNPNLPAGSRVAIGDEVVVEVSAHPHLGCGKFAQRFGVESLKFVNSAVGRSLRLRGVNARVTSGGTVRVGDPVRKLG
jgi:hypothetical protein